MQHTWADDAIFYHIYPLGFCGAAHENTYTDANEPAINKLYDWIDHLKGLGITAIYFGPIFESKTHGYDTTSYTRTDSRLGSMKDFKRLFQTLHDNGIRIVLDGVFNHVSKDFFAYKELDSHLDWFLWNNKEARWHQNWGGDDNLVKLNLRNEEVIAHLLSAVELWMDELGIDGLRLDAVDVMDKDFFRRLRQMTKAKRSDFWLMGELIHGNYRDWVNEEMLDSATNYQTWKALYSGHNDKNYFEIAHSVKRSFGTEGIYKGLSLYSFVDNHDVTRIASQLREPKNLANVYTLLFTLPGIPSIYYGSEFGITGQKGRGADADYALRPCLDIRELTREPNALLEHIKTLSSIYKESLVLRGAGYEECYLRNEQYAFCMSQGEDVRYVALNLGDYPVEFSFWHRGRQVDVRLGAFENRIFE